MMEPSRYHLGLSSSEGLTGAGGSTPKVATQLAGELVPAAGRRPPLSRRASALEASLRASQPTE